MTKKAMIALCRRVTGRANAAELLYRIAYWHPKASVARNGFTWIVKSGAQWQSETGLSHDQYARALARLKKLSLIETQIGFWHNKTSTHLRLTLVGQARLGFIELSAMDFMDAGEQGATLGAIPGHSRTAIPGYSRTATSNKNKSYLQELPTKKDCGHSPATLGKVVKVQKFSAKDVLASKGSPGLLKKSHKTSLDTLQEVWRDCIVEVYGDFVPAFTKQQIGQLGHFAKKCPTDPSAAAILGYVLGHWPAFVSIATAEAGAFNLPIKPQLGPLLKYAGVAVNMAIKQIAQKPTVTGQQLIAPKPPLQTIATPAQPTEIKPGKATLDEVLSILGDDG